uniref:Putative ovule protein n=1 Tax=Solanum chacoense TaxID=4108 RepID=A0A0V0GM26_SOLCH
MTGPSAPSSTVIVPLICYMLVASSANRSPRESLVSDHTKKLCRISLILSSVRFSISPSSFLLSSFGIRCVRERINKKYRNVQKQRE